MSVGLKYFFKAIKDPQWLKTVIKRELDFPRNAYMRTIAYIRIFFNRMFYRVKKDKDVLLFCYDLAINPITFDFVEFIGQAELKRRKERLLYIDVLIIYNDSDEWIPSVEYYSNSVSHEQILFRVHEVIIGVCRLLKSVRNISIYNRAKCSQIINSYKFVYPIGYHSLRPTPCSFELPESPEVFYPMLEPPTQAVLLIEQYVNNFYGKKIVTITLREYGYLPLRNSNLEAWISFAKSLSEEYKVIFIPDASSYHSEYREYLKGFEILDAVCWNLTLRAALYKLAYINLGICGGPMAISLNQEKANTLFFYKTDAYPTQYWEHVQKFYKDVIGTKRRFLRYNNHYVYAEDSFENIITEFEKFVLSLDSEQKVES